MGPPLTYPWGNEHFPLDCLILLPPSLELGCLASLLLTPCCFSAFPCSILECHSQRVLILTTPPTDAPTGLSFLLCNCCELVV